MSLRGRDWLVIVLAAAAVAAVWGFDAAWERPKLDALGPYEDMNGLDSLFSKVDDPDLFPRDYLFHDPAAAGFYTPSYRLILGALGGRTWRDSVVRLVPVLAFVYMMTMSLLIRRFTQRTWLAVLVAASTTTTHWALATFWGVGGVSTALPRTVFLSVAPGLVLLHLEYGRRLRGALGVFALTGLAANLHPVSGAGLVQILFVERLLAVLRGRFRLAHLPLLPVAFAAGALPFVLSFLGSSVEVPATGVALDRSAEFEFLWSRFSHNFIPPSRFHLGRAMQGALPVIPFVILGGWLASRDLRRAPDAARLLRLLAVAALVSIGGTIILQNLARFAGHRFMTIDQLRSSRWLYAAAFPLAAVGIDLLLDRLPRLTRAPAAVACALVLLPMILLPDLGITTRFLPHPVTAAYQGALGRPVDTPPVSARRQLEADEVGELAAWARDHTPDDALFLADDTRFRAQARRSIAFAYKDGGPCYYLGRPVFHDWARRLSRIEEARAARTYETWLALARDLECDYFIVPRDEIEGETPRPIFRNARYLVFDVPGD